MKYLTKGASEAEKQEINFEWPNMKNKNRCKTMSEHEMHLNMENKII